MKLIPSILVTKPHADVPQFTSATADVSDEELITLIKKELAQHERKLPTTSGTDRAKNG